MTAPTMEPAVGALLAFGKGFLAGGESYPAIGKRFEALNIPVAEEDKGASTS